MVQRHGQICVGRLKAGRAHKMPFFLRGSDGDNVRFAQAHGTAAKIVVHRVGGFVCLELVDLLRNPAIRAAVVAFEQGPGNGHAARSFFGIHETVIRFVECTVIDPDAAAFFQRNVIPVVFIVIALGRLVPLP
ncbi:hypothetical protein D1872_271270 [compost metagenome]